jgi:hypothetical protein
VQPPGGAVVNCLLLSFGLGPLQILPVKFFGNRAYVSIFPHGLKFHFPVKICIDTQRYILTHVYIYIRAHVRLSTGKCDLYEVFLFVGDLAHRHTIT